MQIHSHLSARGVIFFALPTNFGILSRHSLVNFAFFFRNFFSCMFNLLLTYENMNAQLNYLHDQTIFKNFRNLILMIYYFL